MFQKALRTIPKREGGETSKYVILIKGYVQSSTRLVEDVFNGFSAFLRMGRCRKLGS